MKRILTVAVAFATMVTVAGCAGLGGKSDEEQIMERIETWSAAVLAQDVDGILAAMADDFTHPDIGGKEQIRLGLEMVIAQGYLDDGTITWEDMEIKVGEDGKTATAGPIDLAGPPGEIAVIVDLEKRDDGLWYLTGGDQY